LEVLGIVSGDCRQVNEFATGGRTLRRYCDTYFVHRPRCDQPCADCAKRAAWPGIRVDEETRFAGISGQIARET
jgi:hypothetical protein